MNHELFIGGDLGTSALKLTLIDEKGRIIRSLSISYPVSYPLSGLSEQDAESYLEAFEKGIGELLKAEEKPDVMGLAIDGQMHGLVALDEKGEPLRKVILWNDSRSTEECRYLNETIGKEVLLAETGNIAYPGFTLPKILWMKNHEPNLYAKIAHVMLPKDYLVYRLTGEFSTDYSDACGTLLLDVKNKRWSEKMIQLSGLPISVLPPLHVSSEKVGHLTSAIAKRLGLSSDVFVLAGAGDNAAGALGSGAAQNGHAVISLGTSGTISLASENYVYASNGAIHSFIGADGGYFLLSCMLSAASCVSWYLGQILQQNDYAKLYAAIDSEKLGQNHVYFLPYLMGERSPINDPSARGCFIGISPTTTQADLTQSILEGVAFALRDSFDALKQCGAQIERCSLTGGGAKSPLWCQLMSDVFAMDFSLLSSQSGASYGMGLLCLVHAGIYSSIEEVEKTLVATTICHPQQEKASLYEKRYHEWKLLYPAIKGTFSSLKR